MLLQVESIRGLARKAADGVGEERQCGGWTRAAAGSGRAECYHRESGVARAGVRRPYEPDELVRFTTSVRWGAMCLNFDLISDRSPSGDLDPTASARRPG